MKSNKIHLNFLPPMDLHLFVAKVVLDTVASPRLQTGKLRVASLMTNQWETLKTSFLLFSAATVLTLSISGTSQAQVTSLSAQPQCSELKFGGEIQRCITGNYPSDVDGTYTPGTVIERSLGGINSVSPVSSFAVSSKVRADYGLLGVSASSVVSNVASPSVVGHTFQALAQAGAVWNDQFTLSSSTLAVGTPVTMRVTQVIDVANLSTGRYLSDLSPLNAVQTGGLLRFNSAYAPTSFCIATGYYSAMELCRGAQALTIGENIITYDTVFQVGQVLNWSSTLGAEAAVTIDGLPNAPATGAVFVDALNTAHTFFDISDGSVNIAWASGHDYRAPSIVSSVPEPETYAMMLAGLCVTGAIARRRKARNIA